MHGNLHKYPHLLGLIIVGSLQCPISSSAGPAPYKPFPPSPCTIPVHHALRQTQCLLLGSLCNRCNHLRWPCVCRQMRRTHSPRVTLSSTRLRHLLRPRRPSTPASPVGVMSLPRNSMLNSMLGGSRRRLLLEKKLPRALQQGCNPYNAGLLRCGHFRGYQTECELLIVKHYSDY